MENEELPSLSLKLWVEKEKNQVVFAESNDDFVDVLFSFMTIPIGRIIKLIGEQTFGCMGNIYASVENLDEKLFQSQVCRDMLLHPISAAEIYCKKLKVNLNEIDGNEYYGCSTCRRNVSYFYQSGGCSFHFGVGGAVRLKLPSPNTVPQEGGVFIKSTNRFMISSDFQIRPFSTMIGLTLLRNLGAGDWSTPEERTIQLGKEKVLELLKCSLMSRKPLTEAFLDPFPISNICGNFSPWGNDPTIIDQPQQSASNSTKREAKFCLKLIVDTVNNKVLYAEVAYDFVDLLCSFLMFPLGYLYKRFSNLTFKGCMDNLYKSIQDLEVDLFESVAMKETLLDSKVALGLDKGFIEEPRDLIERVYGMCSKPHKGKAKTTKGFVKGPSNFMVMDSLAVTPLSSLSELVSLHKDLKIPLSAIAEKEVVMGEDEALRLFMASFVSANALTATFLLNEIKQEQQGGDPINMTIEQLERGTCDRLQLM